MVISPDYNTKTYKTFFCVYANFIYFTTLGFFLDHAVVSYNFYLYCLLFYTGCEFLIIFTI